MRTRDLWTHTDGATMKIGDGFVSGILAAAAVEMHILWPVF